MIIILSILLAFFVLLSCLLGFFLLKFSLTLLDVQESIEDALDVCEQSYEKIAKILELPVAINTPEISHIVNVLQNIKQSVLLISNILAKPINGVDDTNEK